MMSHSKKRDKLREYLRRDGYENLDTESMCQEVDSHQAYKGSQ